LSARSGRYPLPFQYSPHRRCRVEAPTRISRPSSSHPDHPDGRPQRTTRPWPVAWTALRPTHHLIREAPVTYDDIVSVAAGSSSASPRSPPCRALYRADLPSAGTIRACQHNVTRVSHRNRERNSSVAYTRNGCFVPGCATNPRAGKSYRDVGARITSCFVTHHRVRMSSDWS